jgi:flavocytochrome c
MMDTVIVVGGGLAGMSAAHTVLEHGANVIVVEKNAFCGGNSTKATSGINGAGTATQHKKGVQDSSGIFFDDSMRGGANQPELIKVLTYESGPAVEWLIDNHGLDLSLISRLGGHSQPRTHRGGEKFPGMTITMTLLDKLEEICEKQPHRAKILTKCRMTGLTKDASGKVVGLTYVDKDGKKCDLKGPVILATGGYGADYTEDSILTRFCKDTTVDGRPVDLSKLPTTNGDFSTGDGLKAAMAIGGDHVDLKWVQVHPTGLVHPKEPEAKVKFLAAEALRGCGGIIIDKHGKRIANELGRRDYVSNRMWSNEGPFRLLLNGKASKEIEWHCKHYKGRGLMKSYDNLEELAKEMGIPSSALAETCKSYNEIAVAQEKSPSTGKYDAYGGGKTHDPWGKKYFHNYPVEMNDAYHVAIITPVVHYCMGGVKITAKAELVGTDSKVIPGVYGAGEINGGVHGENRLGGSSLLDCVVYGRVAGRTASRFIMEENVSAARSKL